MRKQQDIVEIRRKMRRILSMESKRPNYFLQHITELKNYLIDELHQNVLNEVAVTLEQEN